MEIPFLTTDQMREVDRLMIEEFRIELVQMMENAGRNLAAVARDFFFGGDARGRQVAILCGSGGNGCPAAVIVAAVGTAAFYTRKPGHPMGCSPVLKSYQRRDLSQQG